MWYGMFERIWCKLIITCSTKHSKDHIFAHPPLCVLLWIIAAHYGAKQKKTTTKKTEWAQLLRARSGTKRIDERYTGNGLLKSFCLLFRSSAASFLARHSQRSIPIMSCGAVLTRRTFATTTSDFLILDSIFVNAEY